MQILIKIAISLFLIYVGYSIWKTDIDIKKLRPDRLIKKKAEEIIAQIPSREKDGIYQKDKLVARVENCIYEEKNNGIYFVQLEYSNDLDTGKDFEFQKYILKIERIDNAIGMLSSAPQKGRILQGVYCKILGKR